MSKSESKEPVLTLEELKARSREIDKERMRKDREAIRYAESVRRARNRNKREW